MPHNIMPPPARHCENWNRGITRFFLTCEKSDNNFEKTFIFLGEEENELKDEMIFFYSLEFFDEELLVCR